MALDFSVVVPVYNSEQSLHLLFERVQAYFAIRNNSFEVIFVDDESQDNSWGEIAKLKEKYPQLVRAIRLARNIGQQKATLCGINNSNGNLIVTIDDDLQIPPEEISKLIDVYMQEKSDLVYGLYDTKHHSAFRNFGSRVFNLFFGRFASTTGKGSSFRLLTKQIAERLKGINQKYLLLDEVIQWFTSHIAYCNVEHQKRELGKSGYSGFKLIRIALSYIFYYTIIPLRLMTYLGFVFSIGSFILSLVYIYRYWALDVEPGFTTIIITIFFSTSVILFSLGIIGEYISRIYVQEISRPPYVIKEMI